MIKLSQGHLLFQVRCLYLTLKSPGAVTGIVEGILWKSGFHVWILSACNVVFVRVNVFLTNAVRCSIAVHCSTCVPSLNSWCTCSQQRRKLDDHNEWIPDSTKMTHRREMHKFDLLCCWKYRYYYLASYFPPAKFYSRQKEAGTNMFKRYGCPANRLWVQYRPVDNQGTLPYRIQPTQKGDSLQWPPPFRRLTRL